jgi:hypothetical protein
MANICCSPPDMVPATDHRALFKRAGKNCEHLVDVSRIPPTFAGCKHPCAFSRIVMRVNTTTFWHHGQTFCFTRSRVFRIANVLPKYRCSIVEAEPVMAFMVVVLLLLEPIRETSSPFLGLQNSRLDSPNTAIRHFEAGYFEESCCHISARCSGRLPTAHSSERRPACLLRQFCLP